VEARLFEIEQMREKALTSRVAETDNKNFKEFTRNLDKAVSELQAEVDSTVIDMYDLRNEKGAEGFFNKVRAMISAESKA
jgi:hypothetical protein